MVDLNSEYEIIEYIDSIPSETLRGYSDTYTINDLTHYMTIQIHWMEEEKYLLGTKIHRNPNTIELIDEWDMHHNAERFRAFYILTYTGSVSLSEPEYYI